MRRTFRVVVVVAALLVAFLDGFVVHRTQVFPYKQLDGAVSSAVRLAWRLSGGDRRDRRPAAQATGSAALTDEERRAMEALSSVAYLTGSRPAGGAAGVTVAAGEKAYRGLNLVTSGHGPEVFLMDMEGRPLHSWRCDFEEIWPEYDLPKGTTDTFRRAYLFPNGDLLAIFNWIGLVKLDRDSNVLWSYQGGCGNDLFVADDGTIYVIGNEIRMIPRINRGVETFENFLVQLTPDGEVIGRISLLEALERSRYAPLLDHAPEEGDILHTNTVEVLDGSLAGRCPAFREGNVLLSMRYLNAICVLDPEMERVIWGLDGMWRAQHQPTVLRNGNILIFNNLAGPGFSEVLEFDPFTQEVAWSYRADLADVFYSEEAGSAQRLPNANTLIVESDSGRAFEVTPDGTIVWQYVNPLRSVEDDDLTATLFDLVRLPPDFPLDWLE